MRDMLDLQIAAAYLKGRWANEGPLPDRIKAAMVAVRAAPESDIFWMSANTPNDDLKFRTAIAAVMLEGSAEDRDLIERSMRPIRALSALMSGIPVDMDAALADSENLIPIMELWHETAQQSG